MKKISVLLALIALFFADWALANSAVVTSLNGNVQAQVGTATSRALRLGDELGQGTTVSTGPASSVVLKFDDGQVAALTANSRMTITAYRYEQASGKGNILLSLVEGGMRAITGLIGKNSRENVAYRAATATIGIRGTDVTIVTMQGHVIVTVADGVISFTFKDQTIIIPAGQAIHLRPDGTFSQGSIQQIMTALQGTPLGRAILDAFGGIAGLTNAINAASPGIPRRQGPPDDVPRGPPEIVCPQGPPCRGGAGGGGPPSPS